MLMIRVENCPDICFPIVNLLTSSLIMYSLVKFSLVSQMPKLAGKCLMTGHYSNAYLLLIHTCMHTLYLFIEDIVLTVPY